MIGAFSFNNVESEGFNLVCKSVKRPLLPAVKIKRIELPGSSGVYDFSGHEYEMRQVTMKIQYIGTSYEELRTRARSIAGWLCNPTWSKLILNDEPDKYYLAKVTDEIDLESLWESGSADVVFDCQPFAYAVTEVDLTTTATDAKDYVITNAGTREINYRSPQGSKFLISVTGSFDTLSLSLNGKTINYTEAVASGTVIFDNIEMECTLGGVNKFAKLTGDIDSFLNLLPGNNTLSIAGTGLNISVNIKFIPLWI